MHSIYMINYNWLVIQQILVMRAMKSWKKLMYKKLCISYNGRIIDIQYNV